MARNEGNVQVRVGRWAGGRLMTQSNQISLFISVSSFLSACVSWTVGWYFLFLFSLCRTQYPTLCKYFFCELGNYYFLFMSHLNQIASFMGPFTLKLYLRHCFSLLIFHSSNGEKHKAPAVRGTQDWPKGHLYVCDRLSQIKWHPPGYVYRQVLLWLLLPIGGKFASQPWPFTLW